MRVKKTGAMAFALSALLVLAACGDNGNNGNETSPSASAPASPSASAPASEPASPEASKDPVTLTVMMHADWAKGGPWAEIMKGYEAKSGNKVDLQIVSDNFEQLVLTKIATNDVPDVLFFFSQSSMLKKLNPE